MGMFRDSREEEAKTPGRRRVCPSCNATYSCEALVCPEDGAGLLEVPDAPLLTGTCLESRYDIGGVVGTVHGQGHIQAVGGGAGLFRREADTEQQHAVYRQGEKQCEAKPVAGGYLRCCHGVVILVPAGRRTTVRRC